MGLRVPNPASGSAFCQAPTQGWQPVFHIDLASGSLLTVTGCAMHAAGSEVERSYRIPPGIRQLALHEELLGALRRIEVAFPCDTLHLLQLSRLAGSLNVPSGSKQHVEPSCEVPLTCSTARSGRAAL